MLLCTCEMRISPVMLTTVAKQERSGLLAATMVMLGMVVQPLG